MKYSSFQALSNAIELAMCTAVYKAQDEEEETVVCRLIFPIAAFYSLLVITFSQQNKGTRHQPQENETPHV